MSSCSPISTSGYASLQLPTLSRKSSGPAGSTCAEVLCAAGLLENLDRYPPGAPNRLAGEQQVLLQVGLFVSLALPADTGLRR